MAAGTRIDGRAARGQRTRAAVVEAVIALLERGELHPSIDTVAAEAGVSPRSIFQHFGDREALEAAVADRQAERVREIVRRLPAEGPFEARLEPFLDQRVRVFELIAPVRRSAVLDEPFAPTVAARLDDARRRQRREAERVFAAELGAAPPHERAALRAALAATTAWTAWEALRVHEALSAGEARAALRLALVRLLGGA